MTRWRQRNLPKTHWLDAVCVGQSTPDELKLDSVQSLLIKDMGKRTPFTLWMNVGIRLDFQGRGVIMPGMDVVEFFQHEVTFVPLRAIKRVSTPSCWNYNCPQVVITGGEPFMQAKELTSLCQQLRQQGQHITIETNGTLFQQVEANLLSISPKLANSNPATSNHHFQQHQRLRINQPVLRQFLDYYNCQLKFVVETEPDLVEIQQLQQEMQIPSSTIVLMPQGISRDQIQAKQNWMVEICQQHGYRYSPRLQVDIWGDKRGT